MRSGTIAIALLLVGMGTCFLLEVYGGSTPEYQPGTESEWRTLKDKAINEVKVAPGWAQPRLLGPSVNSAGWEDSACIANDGQTLWFAYIPCDLINWVALEKGDITKFDTFRRGPNRDANPVFAINILECRKRGDAFGPPAVSRWSRDTDPVWQAESSLAHAGQHFVWNTNHPASPTDHDTNIYMDGKRLPAPVNTDKDENDPFFRDGELFFWSDNRPGGMGGKDLWMTRQEPDGGWTEPVLMPEPINSASSDSWQCHLTGDGDLFFTSNPEGPLCIYVSRRTGPGTWSEPEKVVWPSPGSKAVGIAEPTLTSDGSWLYFCVLFKNDNGAFDLDIAYTRRQ